ncbi:MAG: hypothetical protein QXX55_00745 [Candidatus Pacearchaeota archaeon]
MRSKNGWGNDYILIQKKDLKSIKQNYNFFRIFFILTIFIFSLGFLSAQSYSKSFFAYSPEPKITGTIGDVSFPFKFDRVQCDAGQDFVLQVSPTGCIPPVVRSDLLEEQNVPVFCPIVATQLNPLINIDKINQISFSGGDIPREISGIGYYPARAATKGIGRSLSLNQPIMNNIGYAVIVLKQNRNESSMPDYVSGNLTARITYDIKNAFGLGQSVFYLPVMNEDDWNSNYKKYSFWNGRGFLRAEEVTSESAIISIYSDRETYSSLKRQPEKRRIATVNLNLNEMRESRDIYIPGFDFCLGSLQLKLEGIQNPSTTAKLNINGDYFDLVEGEKFIENRCQIKAANKRAALEKVTIYCRDDFGAKTFDLETSPRVELEVNGEKKAVGLGEKVYREIKDGKETGKSVYLVYISTKKFNSYMQEDLKVYLATISGNVEKLDSKELDSIMRFLESNPNINLENLNDKWDISSLEFNELKENLFGNKVKLIGYAGAIDMDMSYLPKEARDYYNKAIEDYDVIIQDFSKEEYPKGDQVTLGQQALYNKIELTRAAGQLRKTSELCKEFQDKYQESSLPTICESMHMLSSNSINYKDVIISGKIYRIFLEGVVEPSFSDYGAEISVLMPNGKVISHQLRYKQKIYLNETTNEYIKLSELSPDFAKLDINLRSRSNTIENTGNSFISGTVRLERSSTQSYSSIYSLTLEKINLNKVAKVSVNPKINYARTNATFGFKIGIEKRGFKLSPETTRDVIIKLNNTIDKLKGINNNLGNIVEGMNYACFVGGTTLIVKNFFENLGGAGIARQKIMREDGGWFDKCSAAISNKAKINGKGPYTSIDECLLDNNEEIERAIEEYHGAMKEQEQSQRFKNIDSIYKDNLMRNLQAGGITNIKVSSGVDVNIGKIIEKLDQKNVNLIQARDLELNAKLLNSQNPLIKEIASKRSVSILTDIYINIEKELKKQELKESIQPGLEDIDVVFYQGDDTKTFIYNGAKSTKQVGQIPEGAFVSKLLYKSGGEYLLQLEPVSLDIYRIVEIYDSFGNKIDKDSTVYNDIKNKIVFKFLDRTTYQNKCVNCKVRYYESGIYKGLGAIVPFPAPSVGEGWYVATRPSGALVNTIQPYAESGRPTYFYICNVGKNGKEEFYSERSGDDICTGFLYKSRQIPAFPLLEEEEVVILKNRAEAALEEAARKYSPGIKNIDILGERYEVGEPAIGVPDIRCQDVMSALDCNLLFNICDPVICPSSRCNLGGEYYVENVIQSGVAGSLLLCTPNFPEVKIPICLSGVHAGIDGYISALDSYRSCLQTSLDTGQTIGICDEIHSVYMCELFWSNALPAVNYVGQKIVGALFDQKSSSGGGEYLGFQDAWKRAGDSVKYFTDYYAKNSFAAFKARSMSDVGTIICKNWVSVTSPRMKDIFNTITSPASPPQFFAVMEEIPFSSVTVTPISHYKVMYHIYAGKQQPAYYQVYLRTKEDSGSFYQDVPSRRIVDQGYINVGQSASQTRDFTAPAGYKEVCVIVNNQEKCDFKQVTTDFGINYITDLYVADQASENNITSESECVSGTVNLYSLLNLNLQSGIKETINPAIYNRGIVRVCSTDNPGKNKDSNAGTSMSRWVEVGYCGNERIKCWLDKESVRTAIKSTNIQEKVIGDVSGDYLEALKKEGGYVEDFEGLVENITKEEDLSKRIELLNKNIEKVFYNHEKGYLRLLRANAFKELALAIISRATLPRTDIDQFDQTKTGTTDQSNPTTSLEGTNLRSIPNDSILPIRISIVTYWTSIGDNFVGDLLSKDIIYSWNGTRWIDETKNPENFEITKAAESNNLEKAWEKGIDFIKEKVSNLVSDRKFSKVDLSCGNTRFTLATKYNLFSTDLKESIKVYSKDLCRFYLREIKLGEFEIESSVCSNPKFPNFTQEVFRIQQANNRVLAVASSLNGQDAPGENCFVPITEIYKKAGVGFDCFYQDFEGDQYTVRGQEVKIGVDKNEKGETIYLVFPTKDRSKRCYIGSKISYEEKINNIAPGDQLDLVWTPESAHSVIFISWVDKEKREALIFDWLGGSRGARKYRYETISLSENEHPVYAHRRPIITSSTDSPN